MWMFHRPNLSGFNGSRELRMRTAFDWAIAHGYAGVIPTFHQENYDGKEVRGLLCFTCSAVNIEI